MSRGIGRHIRRIVVISAAAIVAFQGGRALAAILVSVADHKVRHVFVQVDPDRLRHLGPLN